MKKSIILIIIVAVIGAIAWVLISQINDVNDNSAIVQNSVNVSQSGGQDINNNKNVNENANTNSDSDGIVPSQKRATAPTEAQYEIGGSGLRCWVYDLGDYIPTKDEVAKTYTWIIEFPDDDCVIGKGKPVTNLPETIVGGGRNEKIYGTNYHRTILNYE